MIYCKYSKNSYIILFVLILLASNCFAGKTLKLGSVFKNSVVLQRDMPVPIWGTANPQSIITVEFAGQKKSINTNKDGKWKITLDSLKTSFEPRVLKISSVFNNEVEKVQCTDVLVGEVWICSGQSNMQYSVSSVPEISALSPDSKHIRTYNVHRTVSLTEQDTCQGEWINHHPGSAVAFSFAYFLQKAAGAPVGIILNPWGSSSLEAWMPRDMTETVPHFKTIMNGFDENKEFLEKIQAILDGPKPWSTKDDIFLRRQPNILYNAMMKPLAPYACRGMVWYQGERNTQSMYGEKKEPWWSQNSGMLKYGEELKQWMLRYRKEWGKDDFYFLVVMLPGYAKGFVAEAENPDTTSWAWMRESQLQALDLPYTAVANTIDLGDVKNVHPKDKLPVGKRLALLAQRNTLGEDIEAEGPIKSRVEKRRKELIVYYNNSTGLKTKNGEAPQGFWLSNEKGKWYPAKAEIDGEKVVLKCSELKRPLYIRYAFAGKPTVNLVNGANLPAYPFRTDHFEP